MKHELRADGQIVFETDIFTTIERLMDNIYMNAYSEMENPVYVSSYYNGEMDELIPCDGDKLDEILNKL